MDLVRLAKYVTSSRNFVLVIAVFAQAVYGLWFSIVHDAPLSLRTIGGVVGFSNSFEK